MNAAIPERRLVTEEISGAVERVTFHNDESDFCVLGIKTRDIGRLPVPQFTGFSAGPESPAESQQVGCGDLRKLFG
jgi:hypothetical protein